MNNQVSELLLSRIDAKDFPSAVYLVADHGEIVLRGALGYAVIEPERIEARNDTIYDLASLTKPLITGLLCAKLIESGELALRDTISKYLSEFETSEKRGITIENLLLHTSGLAGWRPFYLISDSKFQNSNRIAADPLETPNGSAVIYSDLNFVLLGILLEKIYGESLDRIAEREILSPLNLKDSCFNPPETLKNRIAACERGNEYEKQMCIDLGYEIQNPRSHFRERLIWGEVHDGNCWFMGGVSGHAGLFSTAEETFTIARQFLAGQTVLLKPETCELFKTNLTKGMNEARSLGFQLAESPESTASNALSSDSFGHVGFTGTSLWIEPASERIFILLTNRTHARKLPFANLNSVRRRFHELAAAQLNK